MQFYFAIILFISSVVAGIISLFAVKNISIQKFLIGGAFHLVCVALFLFFYFSESVPKKDSTSFQLPFIFSICTGIILSGLAWQSKIKTVAKVYFALYSITIVLFVLSPSRLVHFLLTTKYSDTMGLSFPIRENYFLEEQSSFGKVNNDSTNYKIVKKKGFFHQTIQRDIHFAGQLDSILLLQFVSGVSADIRGYSSRVTFVSSETDSMDVSLKLIKETKSQIERRL